MWENISKQILTAGLILLYSRYFISYLEIVKDVEVLFKQDNVVWGGGGGRNIILF